MAFAKYFMMQTLFQISLKQKVYCRILLKKEREKRLLNGGLVGDLYLLNKLSGRHEFTTQII